MTKCPCEIDHWHHLSAGFQGIVGMLQQLERHNVPVTDRALSHMEEQLAKLKELIDRRKHERTQR